MEAADFDWPVELQFTQRNGNELAFRHYQGDDKTIVYLGGFHSNMNGEKAFAVFEFARKSGHSALCLDYSCHGSSSGDFHEATISSWLADVRHIIDLNVEGDFYLCGSSMGAWISLLTALHYNKRVKGLVTIAAATDMTERFIWNRCGDEQRTLLEKQGYFSWDSPYDDSPYILTQKLIDDGRKHLLLEKERIDLDCPVRMLHGTGDDEIVWENSLETLNRLSSKDATLKLFKNADHRLSEPDHIREIIRALKSVL